ncbi:hypothetical protein PHISCL_05207 [Aspergillus sclerotialis]|uniref:Uncharacterized protein n=1 Tax=Aspergillus sclerotialis TaxID=2070753 RepID=A0A3A2ZWV2_9EURO|nr:hypothetical protein PHISCL_05207 [Aspergillus sclerotialis]
MDIESEPRLAKVADQSIEDAQDLAAMGHEQALSRKFNVWSMSALAFCVLGEEQQAFIILMAV